MCGIVAVTGYKKALPLLINGLEKLEYRGYDSAGIAVINSESKNIVCNKSEGKLKNLISNLVDTDISGEPAEVSAICNAVWTTDIKAAWKANLIANKPA